MIANSLSNHPATGKVVQVFIRTKTGQIVHRDGKWDGEKWLVRNLYSDKFSHWDGVELMGWKDMV